MTEKRGDSAGEEMLHSVELTLDYTPGVAIPAVFLIEPVATEVLLAGGGSEYTAGGLHQHLVEKRDRRGGDRWSQYRRRGYFVG